MSFRRLIREWRQWRDFCRLDDKERTLLIYSEDSGYWSHLGPVVDGLLERFNGTVCYITSDESDPQLARHHRKLRSFYVGNGVIRTWFFTTLNARVLLMTMPDLETYYIKRSKAASVHYVYLFHSLVSTHMIYRSGAFDHFDTILCSGPHHREEIRETERVYQLPAKELRDHGYGRIDTIRREAPVNATPSSGLITVLVAPSWGPEGILETRGVELATILVEAGFVVIFRPHPMTGKKWPEAIEALTDRFSSHDRFSLDVDMSSKRSLEESDVMISDWSGAALEYAFGLERPVVFIDVPRKVNNPDYERINLIPFEVSVRSEVGRIISVENLPEIPQAVRTLRENQSMYREQIDRVLRKSVYNLGHSADAGVDAIIDIVDRLSIDSR